MTYDLDTLQGTNYVAELLGRADSEAIAIRFQGQSLSYWELDDASARFAQAMVDAGVRPGDPVLVFMTNNMEYGITILALLRLGAQVVAAKSSWARSELDDTMRTARCRFVVTDGTRTEVLRSCVSELDAVFVVDPQQPVQGTERRWALAAERLADQPTEPSGPCVVMFTSGTTGPRKGAVYSQNGLFEIGRTMAEIFPETRWVGLCKDVAGTPGLARLLLAMFLGVELSLYPQRGGLAQVLPDLQRPGGNLAGVPSEFRGLLEAARAAGSMKLAEGTVLLWGGELISTALIEAFRKEFGVELHGFYAASEFFPITTEVLLANPLAQRSLGAPAPGIEVKLVADGKVVTEPNTPGQAFVRQPHMALYYVLRDGTTEPIGDEDGWYDTGDILYRDDQGCFWCEGRVTDGAKRHGSWVALDLVSEALTSHDATVDQACTVVLDAMSGDEGLASFVVLKPGVESEAARGALDAHLKATIAAFAIPDQIIIVDQIPTAGSGKADRKVLRAQALTVRTQYAGKSFVDARPSALAR